MIEMKNNIETTIDSYNKIAEEYFEKTFKIDVGKKINQFLSYMSKRGTILDVGCGPGRDAKTFTDKGYTVVGIDLSDNLLEIARGQAPKAQFINMDIRDMDFDKDSFDGIWAMSSLMHLEKEQFPEVLEKCHSLLMVDSPFYFCLKRGDGERLEPDKRYGGVEKYFSYYQDDEIKRILSGTKFEILDFGGEIVNDSYATNPWIDIFLKKGVDND